MNRIACRVSVFGTAQDAFERLARTGIRCAEIGVPDDLDFSQAVSDAESHGVTVTSVATGLILETPRIPFYTDLIHATADAGIERIFVSVKAVEGLDREALVDRFRDIAERAATRGVAFCMETHPPLGTNGEEALRTLREVNSSGLRYNFDTANIYYYNQHVDGLEELAKVADWVGSVHLKDTDGGYQSDRFPILGQGIVDFPGVFRLLSERGFRGPYTMEIEGPLTAGKTVEEREGIVKACAEYLRGIGVLEGQEES